MFPDPVHPRSCPAHPDTMAGVFPMDDVVLDGCETSNGHDNFSDDDCIEVGSTVALIHPDLSMYKCLFTG